MASAPLHVAIIGGGLCGLSLAIALTRQSMSYTIYEAKGSFTEIGAGINLGPNALQAFDLIDPSTREAIFALATRNAPGNEDVWFTCRLAAATNEFEDGHLLGKILAPPTGNMTLSRNELLHHLAKAINLENAKFNKRLAGIVQDEDGVTLSFADGTKDRASLLVGCDGVHSSVRRLMLGPDHPAAAAKYTQTGAYRAIIPMTLYEKTVGSDIARNSHVWLGPKGYIIQYPINRGQDVNIGIWPRKDGEWDQEAWVVPNQKAQMLEDMRAWGGTMQSVFGLMSDDTSFWASFHHSAKPDTYFQGRVCLIGDGAHAMVPHQGAGSSQGMEDACVMAEVLRQIDQSSTVDSLPAQIEAAFAGYEKVRKPRYEAVLDSSAEVYSFWADFLKPDLEQRDIDKFHRTANEKFWWIWEADIPGQCEQAVAEMQTYLKRALRREVTGSLLHDG